MKLYAPSYYPSFRCIADQCKHSCCIGWEIDIDADAIEKYKASDKEYANAVRDSIADGDTPHFRLSHEERCPHLSECGLCKIILSLGEDYLCEICREHPRFYLFTARGCEVGIGMACEEACRLILTSADYTEFSEIGEIEGEAEDADFDASAYRDRILALLSDTSIPYKERKETLCRIFSLPTEGLAEDARTGLLEALEYLNEQDKSRFLCPVPAEVPPALAPLLERALAYFIFRHCSTARDSEELRASLGLALFCEELIAAIAVHEGVFGADGMVDVARTVSEEIEYSEDNTDAIKLEFSLIF